MLFKKLFKIVYDSEVNCRIEWMWDGGYTWCVLDGSVFPRILKDDEFDNDVKITARTEEDFLKSNNRTHEKDWKARGCREDIDEALCDMFTAIIDHFPDSQAAIKLKDFDENREHFIVCNTCGDLMDCRDLGDVFEHEHDKEAPVIDGSKLIAKKEGDNVAWKDGKQINLN